MYCVNSTQLLGELIIMLTEQLYLNESIQDCCVYLD